MKTTTIKSLVDVIIVYCKAHGLRITPLKLQKLLYYVQAWHIAKFNKENLFVELPQAWVNGPVYRSVYDLFKEYFFKNEDIPYSNEEIDYESLLQEKIEKLGLSKNQNSVISSVLKFYAPQDDGVLVLKTHADKPWNDAREGLNPFERSTNTISVDSMNDFYSKLL